MHYYDGTGRYDNEYKELWKKLVPKSGQADTIQGELVRVIGRLADEFYRNGNGNWNINYRLFTNFLYKHLSDYSVFDMYVVREIRADIQTIRDLGGGRENSYDHAENEDAFDRVTSRVVEWCKAKSDLIPMELNPKLKR